MPLSKRRSRCLHSLWRVELQECGSYSILGLLLSNAVSPRSPRVDGRPVMSSPYVRRLRLGMELQALRDERNWTQARVARMIGKTRQELSKMERGLAADPADVLNLLDALGVDDERWTELTGIARDAVEPGGGSRSRTSGTGRPSMRALSGVRRPSASTTRRPCPACCRSRTTSDRRLSPVRPLNH
jgi:transcriptional regulator with XRE-family HTH domain